MQINTTVRYHLTLVSMSIIKKSTNNKCWSGKGNPLTLLVGMKTVQVLWRRVWRFLKKLGLELPYDSAYKGLYSQSYGFTSSYIWM